ncbi:MAG: hypothetical protein K2M57_10185 [Paramuribaculum sp.]|nr:hypothetical protein [Paramuribaculum sp.]
MTIMTMISLTIVSCQESSDDLITESVKLEPINAIVKGTVGDYHGIRVLHVSECDKKWWADSLDYIFLQSDELGKFDINKSITAQLSGYVPYPFRTEGDSLFYYVRISDILKSRTTQEMKQDCAEFEPLAEPTLMASRSSFSSLTPLVVNVYVHFMKDINGGSTSGSSLASAQQIVKDLNKAFSGTKISFWLKGYNNLSLNYSTFSNNDKNELVKLFNQDSHSDCIDMYMLSRTPDKDIKDGTETVGGTIATSYPTSLSIKHNNGNESAIKYFKRCCERSSSTVYF